MAGRHKKYHTIEELKKANIIKAKRYYQKNKKKIQKKNKMKYHENKESKENK